MRLSELHPELIVNDNSWILYHDCLKHREERSWVHFNLEGGAMPYWKVVGDINLETLTLEPSIRLKGHYHINITNGNIIDHGDE